ncbi:hypothetical protein ACFL1S_01300 [Pseudomonadota bacterium]
MVMALQDGKFDAIQTLSNQSAHLQGAAGKIKAIEDLSRYTDWILPAAKPRRHHLPLMSGPENTLN